MSEQISVIDYLLTRLEQVGVDRIFGVPGDFNLVALDSVEDHKTIKWIGCANELNASYAADGYARVRQSLGVLFTTFGVGELSAVNGIAGCFSERVPVLHIVGVPSSGLQSKGALLHHTLGDGRFDAYSNIYKNITISQASLAKPHNKSRTSDAGEEIDRIITTCLKSARPTYLTLPTDSVGFMIPSEPLKTPITLEGINKSLAVDRVDESVDQNIIKQICAMYERSSKPIALIDACAIRYGVQKEARELIEQTGMPFFTSPMGKTALDETHPQFGGIYVGDITNPAVKEAVESADFTLYIGALKSDFNTGSFSWRIAPEDTVELHSDHTLIQYAHYPNAGFQSLLPKLIPEMAKNAKGKSGAQKVALPENAGLGEITPAKNGGNDMLTQDEFWPLWSKFFQEKDIVLAETGTSSFGILDTRFPANTTLLTQILYGSIGWATGATLGASLAGNDTGRRTILFTGDGSIQLTVQEVSTMLRQGATPILVVLNNSGYVIERAIHGPDRVYNDIAGWHWQDLLGVFGAKEKTRSYRVNTRKDLEDLFANKDFAKADKLQLVEVMLGRQDTPRALRAQAKRTEEANAEED